MNEEKRESNGFPKKAGNDIKESRRTGREGKGKERKEGERQAKSNLNAVGGRSESIREERVGGINWCERAHPRSGSSLDRNQAFNLTTSKLQSNNKKESDGRKQMEPFVSFSLQ